VSGVAIDHRPDTSLTGHPRSESLADVLERVLDKGIVIAGDIQINLLDIELLTIKLRLVVASVDKAKEIGIDWWERDPALSSGGDHDHRLEARLDRIEKQLGRLGRGDHGGGDD
jgi:Gas vesicle protein